MAVIRVALLVLLVGGMSVQAGDWPRFRGPNGSGVSPDSSAPPNEWSPDENIRWKVELPGPGVSSPIVVGDRVFVTCYSGYGIERGNPGEMRDLKRHLVCVDAGTGEVVWSRAVDPILPEDPFSGIGVTAHGYASHTPVSDGERVYVFFGKTGALAFDMDGNQLWHTELGTESDPWSWGSSSSPILYGNLLIVTASAESQALVGLNRETGEEVWRQEATGLDGVWGTPALVTVSEDRTDLVLGVPGEVWAFNPENGKLRWYAEGIATDQYHSSVIVDGDVVYSIEGRSGGSVAVRAGGKGDVTDSHVLWTGSDTGRFGTPVIHDGRIYHISNGVAKVLDAKTGDRIQQLRLQGASGGDDSERGGRGGPGRGGFGRRGGGGGRGGGGRGGDYSSPVLAGGYLYYVKASGETHVLKAGETLESVAVNQTSDGDGESFGGTPAVSNGYLYLRSNRNLYCIGDGERQAAR
ncbi:PQQ-binding-like beta-propeller repeat protein [Maioricimonas sp. JC845]|uniref:outer membrane protein assembly factor BamB family protein n=1 Tax=Maioricimonas sp. JC845 TaxID=3232138 RepID=UPI0034582259